MAYVKTEKVVTGFNINLNPNEYRIILEALTEHLDTLVKERNQLLSDESYEYGTEHVDKQIEEVAALLRTIEDGIDGQTTIG